MSEPWLKKAEVARELQVSERTVTRHIRPSGIVGGQNRYLMSDVRRQISSDLPDNVVRLRPVKAA